MSKHKQSTSPSITTNPNPIQQQKPDEIQSLKLQVQRLVQEYQALFQQALAFKEASYQSALATNALIRTVTSRLLDIEVTDENVRGQLNSIIKDINQLQKPAKVQSEKQPQQDQGSDPI